MWEDQKSRVPLPERMRPTTLNEFLGHEKILGPGKMLREAIEKDAIPSFILWGPPGCGKTTLSKIIRKSSKAHFVSLVAVSSGIADVRKVFQEAEIRRKKIGQKTILFIDEIHRFNKAQQATFLPFVEDGSIILIGATTENPYFEVISPLLSRARVYRMEALTEENIRGIIIRAMEDDEKGLAGFNPRLDDESLDFLVGASGGDVRMALNALETAITLTGPDSEGSRNISRETLLDSLQSGSNLYDRKGEEHFNTASAFIKSIRGSDPDAALYWLARMINSGEDPRFIARRMLISASEDIGLANPFALTMASATAQAVQMVGMPEARIILAEAVIYLACSPKSNSAYKAIGNALNEVRRNPNAPVPMHLRNATVTGMKEQGYGIGYKYPHDFPGHFVFTNYFPDGAVNRKFYEPMEQGYEAKLKDRLKGWWGE